MKSTTSNETPKVYVGTYGKYNSGSIDGEWVDLTQFSDRDEFYEYCKELHSDEDDPEFMFQDYEYIPKEMIEESWISEELWDMMDLYEKYGYTFLKDVMSERGIDDVNELRETLDNMYFIYTDDVEEAVMQFCEETGSTESPEWCANYFDFEKYGRDIRLSGDLYMELDDIDDEEEREEREEELSSMSDYEIGEYFVDMVGSVEEAVSKDQLVYYIDWERVTRELGWDTTIIESEINGDDVVAIVW